MNLKSLVESIRAEDAAAIVLFNDGSALLVPEPGSVNIDGDTIHFKSLADLEKNFSQPPPPPTPDPCTCDQATTLLRDCLAYIEKKSPSGIAGPACHCDAGALKQKLQTFLNP